MDKLILSNTLDFNTTVTEKDLENVVINPLKVIPEQLRKEGVEKWFQNIPLYSKINYPGKGEIVWTKDKLEKIIEVFSTRSNPMSLSYDHQDVEASKKQGPVPNAGWITGLGLVTSGEDITKYGLWAKGLFTKESSDLIKSGHYLYNSSVVYIDCIDRITGELNDYEMWNITLTNNPRIDGQIPIILSKEEIMIDKDKAVDVKVEDKTPVVVADNVEAQTPPAEEKIVEGKDATALIQLLAEAVGVDVPTLLQVLETRMDKVVDVLKGDVLIESSGCEGMSKDQKAAVAAAKEGIKMTTEPDEKDAKILLLSSENNGLKSKVAAYEAKEKEEKEKAKKDKIEAKLDEFIKLGNILPINIGNARLVLSANFEDGCKFISCIHETPMTLQAGPDPKIAAGNKGNLLLSSEDAFLFNELIKYSYTEEEALKKIPQIKEEASKR